MLISIFTFHIVLETHERRMRRAIRFFLISSLILIFVNEYVVYIVNSFTWPEMKCQSKQCTKILFVADPQILGEYTESFLSRYDSDRYLRNTFTVALNRVNPDGIIFLGDLEDEGSLADEKQYDRYYRRLNSIFQIERSRLSKVPVIIISGDNDIGGEDHEIIKAGNVRRFRKYFGAHDTGYIKHINIFKVNKLLRTYPVPEESLTDNSTLTIAVSHMPLTDVVSQFTNQVIHDIKPDFIFSAHAHKSYAILTTPENGKQLYFQELKHNAYMNNIPTWKFKGASSNNYSVMTEIVVPTCSYRMGTKDIGYGVIVYDSLEAEAKEIMYHVLWLPERFFSLRLYAVLLLLFALKLFITSTYFKRSFRKGGVR